MPQILIEKSQLVNGLDVSSPRTGLYFRRTLLRWYRVNARPFPWRETEDPYQILLSEVLLQRTQASQVKDNYAGIIAALPTPRAVTRTTLASMKVLLRPLGLAKRPAILKKMGEELVTRYDGRVPSSVTELESLPGVGHYIATATAAFASGARVAVVDANVIRVLARFFGAISPKTRPRDDPAVWRLAQSLLPQSRVADYNRALIDFAALVCRPRIPNCRDCPLRMRCRGAPAFRANPAVRQD